MVQLLHACRNFPENAKATKKCHLPQKHNFYDVNNRYHLQVILKGAEPYGSTIQFINGLTTYYNNLLNRRTTDSPNAEAEPAAVDATV
jgi:hypothetical protein